MSNPSASSLSSARRRGFGRVGAAVLAFATVATLALPALAGTVQIKDSADALTSEQEAALQKAGGQYPFDVRVLTTDNATNKNAFDSYVGQQVSEPNMVVVAVDPQHHRTSVHFGTGTRIGAGEYRAIEDAGDSHFRDKDFAGGITAILERATKAVGSGPVLEPAARGSAGTLPATGAARSSSGSGIGTWIVLLGVGFIVVMVALAFLRRRSGGQAAGYAQGPYVGGPPPGGGYGGQPYYGPQPGGYGGGGSGLGGNLMSAGLGGLVGYEIGKATSEHQHDGGGSNYVGGGDSGGGGNDTSSYDAGGSTSDWSGGGGDSGGGGFDGGGGGGDFGGGGDSGGGGGDW